jgi:hypothetical protein
MVKRAFRFLVLIVFCAILTTGAVAKSGIYIGVHGGWSLQNPSLEGVNFESDSSFLYGARLGVKFMAFAIEGCFSQVSHGLVLTDLLAFDWSGVQVEYNYLGINGKLFIPLVIVHPYVTVGYGSYTANFEDIGQKDSSTAFNFGVGVEVQLGDSFSLLAEGKYHNVTIEIDETDVDLKNYTLVGGFNLYF